MRIERWLAKCSPWSTASAYVDPVVTLTHNFSGDTAAYAETLSPGVGNTTGTNAVPEPASWTMLIGGFGLTGAATRRRVMRASL